MLERSRGNRSLNTRVIRVAAAVIAAIGAPIVQFCVLRLRCYCWFSASQDRTSEIPSAPRLLVLVTALSLAGTLAGLAADEGGKVAVVMKAAPMLRDVPPAVPEAD